MLTDPFDIVFTGDVARRAVLHEELCATLLTEYRVFLHECLQTAGLVVAPNGWMIGAGPDDDLAGFLATRTEEDLVELAPPEDGGLDFDELSYGIALEGGEVAFWLPTFGGALIAPGPVATARRLIEPLYAPRGGGADRGRRGLRRRRGRGHGDRELLVGRAGAPGAA